jgi:hypothetical protein
MINGTYSDQDVLVSSKDKFAEEISRRRPLLLPRILNRFRSFCFLRKSRPSLNYFVWWLTRLPRPPPILTIETTSEKMLSVELNKLQKQKKCFLLISLSLTKEPLVLGSL